MLILRRKKDEVIRIGKDIRITVAEIGKDSVRLAIEAPAEVRVMREELLTAARVNQEAAEGNEKALKSLLETLQKKEEEE